MKFLFHSDYGEIADLAIWLCHVGGYEVQLFVVDHAYEKIAEGIVPHIKEWYRFIGQDYIWVFDGCAHGDLQDWLRQRGELVVGGCSAGDELENNRQLNQDWFREAGFDIAKSRNFTSIDEVTKFVEKHTEQRWILKQNADAPKSINHLGKFDHSEDMLFHLAELKRSWSEQEFGSFNCDLMEVVEGTEVAASAFFNGTDWLRDSVGCVVGYLNFEEKKEADGGLGETTGEMGTTFVGASEDNKLFRNIILRPALAAKLKEIGFHGVFDVNCIVDGSNIYALEPTMRFGIPATSYELIEGLDSDPADLLAALARGEQLPTSAPLEITNDVGMVMCVVAKPFPLEADVEESATSLGERLWILDKDGQPASDFTLRQRQHVHLYNFEYRASEPTEQGSADGEASYRVATKVGYHLTVTHRGGAGASIGAVRRSLIKYIRSNIYLSGMKWRSDIGQRVEEADERFLREAGLL